MLIPIQTMNTVMDDSDSPFQQSTYAKGMNLQVYSKDGDGINVLLR
jgi:hypothetical protein